MLIRMDAHVSRRSLALLAAGAAALLAAACGPGAILTAETPDQAVAGALQAVQTTPLRASLTGQLTLNTASLSGLPASIQSALGQIGSGGSATGRLVQESSARRQLTLSADGSSLSLVEYDGQGTSVRAGVRMRSSRQRYPPPPSAPRTSAPRSRT